MSDLAMRVMACGREQVGHDVELGGLFLHDDARNDAAVGQDELRGSDTSR